MARNGRADCSPSCPLLEVYVPRQPMTAEAVDDRGCVKTHCFI